MKCPRCGTETMGTKFCSECGYPLQNTQPNQQPILQSFNRQPDIQPTPGVQTPFTQGQVPVQPGYSPQYGQTFPNQPPVMPQQAYMPPTIIINNANNNTNTNNNLYGAPFGYGISTKSKWVAFVLCLFLGLLGIHRFYVGKIGTGLLWFFTGGLFFIGWFVDLLSILTGSFKDSIGLYLRR